MNRGLKLILPILLLMKQKQLWQGLICTERQCYLKPHVSCIPPKKGKMYVCVPIMCVYMCTDVCICMYVHMHVCNIYACLNTHVTGTHIYIFPFLGRYKMFIPVTLELLPLFEMLSLYSKTLLSSYQKHCIIE